MTQDISGTAFTDTIYIGRGSQSVDAGDGDDRIVSYGDAGEPDPAQTDGDDGRYTPPVPASETIDTLTGGDGADRFEFHALLDGTEEVVTQHTEISGEIDWASVTGENDNVHDHWVVGFGFDVITDFSKDEGDSILIKGHTATIASITYGEDENGNYSLITVISQQGDGGAAGANTATGAHDEDPLGQIKVYGDQVTAADIEVQNSNHGVDRLDKTDLQTTDADPLLLEVYSNTDGTNYDGSLYTVAEAIHIGEGSQTVDAGGGNDRIFSYSDDGEPDPAQTNGAEGRINPPVPDGAADDVLIGGQGKDTFAFRLLLNATEQIQAKHTRDDGTVNWKKVAGENNNVHDHWVEGIGNEVILDFSLQDGDVIDIRGHTVEIASITYAEDEGGDYSLITLRSQQGDGGGAHDEDLLGTIKVYGDKVTEDQIILKTNVFYGVDQLDEIAALEAEAPASTPERVVVQPEWGADDPSALETTLEGTDGTDVIHAGSGAQTITGGKGEDRLISYADAGEPDPAQTVGSEGRVNPPVPAGYSDDVLIGGEGADRFEFHALLNARAEVIAYHTDKANNVDWQGVAGENDNVHDHWVEGIGNDTVNDFSKAEGDEIIVRGHTVSIAEITYSTDEGGDYSLIRLVSQQGDGGAGGANTATGAHDEDPLGTIKVYGDKVLEGDITVQAAGVFDGIDSLNYVDALNPYDGGNVTVQSSDDGALIETAPISLSTVDKVEIGYGAQTVSTGAGSDVIKSYSDAGEPDPAQTDGSDGRYDPAIDPAKSGDILSGGQGADTFHFTLLLNATDSIIARHTASDGTIDWRQVAKENDAVHDHWVEGIGDEIVLDYSKQDGDEIIIEGHTVEVASITYGDDEGGDFSLITLRSQQGANGGAHDEDPLGTIKVYGDVVEQSDITVQADVFAGIDKFDPQPEGPQLWFGADGRDEYLGVSGAENIQGGRGNDVLNGQAGSDFIFGENGKDTLIGGEGADFLDGGADDDRIDGGAGTDTIYVSAGYDIVTGGRRADSFVLFGELDGAQIMDWEDGLDVIDLSRADNVSSFSDLAILQTSDLTSEITFENDAGVAIVINVQSATAFSLTADDFLF